MRRGLFWQLLLCPGTLVLPQIPLLERTLKTPTLTPDMVGGGRGGGVGEAGKWKGE